MKTEMAEPTTTSTIVSPTSSAINNIAQTAQEPTAPVIAGPSSAQLSNAAIGVKDETMADASEDDEETEEEAVEREIDELIVGAKEACRFLEHDDRNGQLQCMCVSGDTCGTGQQIWRKVISDFFGRNKKNAQQIPELYQVIWCRKHYQRGAYQKGRPGAVATSGKQSSLGKITWIVVQLLFFEKWRPDCRYSIGFNEKEKKRLKVANGGRVPLSKTPKGKGKTGRTNVKTEKDAPIDVVRSYQKYIGDNKTTRDCLLVVNEMKYDVEDDNTTYLPGLEFLAEVDDNFELPRRVKKTDPASKDDDSANGKDGSKDDANEGDKDEDNETDDEGTADDSHGTPGDTSITEAAEGGDTEIDDLENTSSRRTVGMSRTEGPSRLDKRPGFIADRRKHGHSRPAKIYPMTPNAFTSVNTSDAMSPEYSSSDDDDGKYELDDTSYPPDDPRNPIRQQVMRMRMEYLANKTLAHHKATGRGRSPGTPLSVSSAGSTAQAINDLLRLQRNSKPIDSPSITPVASGSDSASTYCVYVPKEDIPLALEQLSNEEQDAVDGLILLKNRVRPDKRKSAIRGSAVDFRPQSHPLPVSYNHSAFKDATPSSSRSGSLKRRHTSDGNGRDARFRRRGLPMERPIKRIRARSCERSLYLE